MRWVWVVSLLLVGGLIPVAGAHGDAPGSAGTASLEPGASVSWTREVHWHRLMGTIAASGPVVVTVEGPLGATRAAGPGGALLVDHLVTCCRSTTWAPHTVHVTNVGEDPIDVRYDLVLLHDNLAVVAHDAEVGAWWQTLAIIGAIIAIPAWRARQPPPDPSSPARPIRASRRLHLTAWGLAGLPSLVGMVRFRTGPLTGSLGSTAWIPMDLGGFFNTHAVVMLGLMALWGASIAFWAAARRRSEAPGAYRLDGLAFSAGSLLVGGLMALEFGPGLIPFVVGTLPALGLLVDAFWQRGAGGPA